MALEKELEQRSIAISKIDVDAREFVMKLQLLRCGPILEYKTDKSEGVRQQLIFVDEEGTKIQTTLFGDFVDKWKTILEASKPYYVINGRIRRAKMAFNNVNVNRFKELLITQFSEIVPCTSQFLTIGFSNGFSSLDEVQHMNSGLHYDVYGVLVETTGVIETTGSKRRVAILTNESHARVAITLWGDYATYDGLCLDIAENRKSIIGFCNVKMTEFNGTRGFASTGATSVILNPKFERADELHQWNSRMIDRNIDISMVPSKQMLRALEMKIPAILDSNHDKPEHVFCKFNARVKEVLKKDSLCYRACIKCNKKVDVYENFIYCERCVAHQNSFTYRYFIQILLDYENCSTKETIEQNEIPGDINRPASNNDDTNNPGETFVSNKDPMSNNKQENTITVKLFDGGKYLLGCNADVYMSSIEQKPHESPYYQRMISAEGQSYTFMVKNYHKIDLAQRNSNMIIEEMHPVDHAGVPEVEHAGPSKPAQNKRTLQDNKMDPEHGKLPTKKMKNTRK